MPRYEPYFNSFYRYYLDHWPPEPMELEVKIGGFTFTVATTVISDNVSRLWELISRDNCLIQAEKVKERK